MVRQLLGAIVVAAVATSLSTVITGPHGFSPWNIGLGVSAGLVLVGGLPMAGAVVAGGLIGAWASGWATPVGSGLFAALGNGISAAILGLFLRRLIRNRLNAWTVRDVVLVIAGALAAGVASALWAGSRAALAGTGAPASFGLYFPIAVGAAVGVILGVPAVAGAAQLVGHGVRAALRGLHVEDVALHALFTLGVGTAAYLLRGPTGERFWSLYLIPMLWTAFRFGMPGVVAAQVLVSLQAIGLALMFATPATTLINYHFLLFNFTANGLLVAAALNARRAAERAKRRSDAVLAGAFHIMDDGLVLFRSDDGVMLDMNEAWLRLMGRPRTALVGESVFTLAAWERGAGERLRVLVGRGHPVREFMAELREPAGTLRTVLVVVESVAFESEVFGVAFIRDVTESRLIERQRLQSQKLEAVGLLASGVAHDFNNILMVISASGQMLRDGIGDEASRRADVESILDASQRGAQLTRQLLAFSRQRPDAPPRPHDVAGVIDGMLGMLRRLLGTDVQIETHMEAGVTAVAAPGQLEQVILNLAVNARDAMGGRGALELEVRSREISDTVLVPEVGGVVAAGRWAVITACDTGAGIDPAIVSRIFEPFFTTKPEDKGTGLGLSTVYGIVKGIGGHIGVQSVVGGGTTFTLYWPAAGAD